MLFGLKKSRIRPNKLQNLQKEDTTMGYVIREGQIQQARQISSLTPEQKKEIFKQTARQKEVTQRLLKRKELRKSLSRQAV